MHNPTPLDQVESETPLIQALVPVVILMVLIVYGLIVRPLAFGQSQIPLEIIFILAAAATVLQLLLLGHSWVDIQTSIVAKFQKAIPAFMILFCIGLVITLVIELCLLKWLKFF